MPDALAELRDIHLPEAIGFWPLAYGYWVLLLLALVGAALWYRRYRRFDVHRAAEQHLNQLLLDYRHDSDAGKLAKAVNVLIRRTALSLKPRVEAASLTGAAWMSFVHNCAPDSGFVFSQDSQRVLTTGVYQKETSVNAEELIDECRRWIKRLPAPPAGPVLAGLAS